MDQKLFPSSVLCEACGSKALLLYTKDDRKQDTKEAVYKCSCGKSMTYTMAQAQAIDVAGASAPHASPQA